MINSVIATSNNTYVNSYVERQIPEVNNEAYRGEIKRGDIFYVDLNGFVTGSNSLQKGTRPFVCISNQMCNTRSSIITGVLLTSQIKNYMPTHVYLEKGYGNISMGSTVLCEGIISIAKKYILEYVGHVEDDKMKEIDKAIKIQLQIKDEVKPATVPIPVQPKQMPNDIEKFNKAKKLLSIIEQTDIFILTYEPRKIEEAMKKREMEIAEFNVYCREQKINSSKIYDEMYFTHKINMLYRDSKMMMG